MSDKYQALRAERDALREDAERYRWLRSRRSLDLRTDGTHWTASDGTRFVSTHYLAADGTQHAPAPSLDASIDAARAALDAQPEPAPTRHADEDACRLTHKLTGPRPKERRMNDEAAGGAPLQRSVRRVVCAAIRANDGDVLIGVRHYSPDMYAQIHARSDGVKFRYRSGDDQGFVDQRGEYMTRRQAWNVAEAAGQVRRAGHDGEGVLYSEDLY